jgi:hypothetical protein
MYGRDMLKSTGARSDRLVGGNTDKLLTIQTKMVKGGDQQVFFGCFLSYFAPPGSGRYNNNNSIFGFEAHKCRLINDHQVGYNNNNSIFGFEAILG